MADEGTLLRDSLALAYNLTFNTGATTLPALGRFNFALSTAEGEGERLLLVYL